MKKNVRIPQEEIDQKSVIRLTWRKLLEVCERVTDMLQSVQGKYKRQLIRNVKVSASFAAVSWHTFSIKLAFKRVCGNTHVTTSPHLEALR